MPLDRMIPPLIGLPRGIKRSAAVVLDCCLGILTVWIAFYLRLGSWVALSDRGWQAAALSLIAIPTYYAFGIYQRSIRYSESSLFPTIVLATIVYGAVYSSILTAVGIVDVPRTIGFIQPGLFLLVIMLSRSVVQFLLSGGYQRLTLTRHQRSNVLIYGAGSAGRQLATALAESTVIRAVGFIDDNPNLRGSVINGLKVGSRNSIGAMATKADVTEVFLAIPSVDRQRRNEILDVIRQEGLAARTLPGLLDIAHGTIIVTDVKPLDIDDLLGRDTVAPVEDLLQRNIRNKCVIVTGAGGSIGSELCRQIVRAGPRTLLLFDVNEFALYSIHRELSGVVSAQGSPLQLIPLLGSVADRARLDEVFSAWRPDTVYHAAAYKHVPLVEHNVIEGVRNNVIGTWQAANAAMLYGARDFVLISTDKAVRPTNIMGATKRMAEMLLQALSLDQCSTCFSIVRFGNVLGSSGSVVPLFRDQISMGGPLTITHPDIIRYFMTIPEAAQLVIQAGAMGKGGEVFVLDMGEPVKIYDLAVRMIELAGLRLKASEAIDDTGDIEIVFTGLRPGEKLYEELLIGSDPSTTHHPRVMMANERYLPLSDMLLLLKDLSNAINQRDVNDARNLLMRAVEEFTPTSEIVDWVMVCKSENSDIPQSVAVGR